MAALSLARAVASQVIMSTVCAITGFKSSPQVIATCLCRVQAATAPGHGAAVLLTTASPHGQPGSPCYSRAAAVRAEVTQCWLVQAQTLAMLSVSNQLEL